MNQLDKEDGGVGFNAHGGDPDPEPESKRIKLDVDDPNIQHIKENQVDDGSRKPMEEALSDTSTHGQPSETKYVDMVSFILDDDDDYDDDEDNISAHDASAHEHDARGVDMREEWDRELAENGVDIEKLKREKWPDWQGRCKLCGVFDMHPTEECLYFQFVYY